LKDVFERLAPVKTGTLRRSASVEIRDYKEGAIIVGIMGPLYGYVEIITNKKGKSRRVQPAKYLHLIEGGTKKCETRSGQNRGIMPARPFIHQARLEVATQVADIFKIELEKQLSLIGR
jgi:hypothetical protein